ncbi:MAG TPA: hypothetical protein VMR16_03880 [Candidatus Saccharimonadales bacterium]|nr:hypothetical protein [Candidatus Saccharimonadales bacterium]
MAVALYTNNPTRNVGFLTTQGTTTIQTGSGTTMMVWNGSAWVPKVVKVWNGSDSSWEVKHVKVWNGSAWVLKG